MKNILASFAIHADDVQRCRRFYERVFGWRFEPWGPPDFYLVHTDDARMHGLMHKRLEPRGVGGPNCFECSIAVDDIEATTKILKAEGVKVLHDRAPIPTVGVLTKFEDTEGNVLGAIQYEAR